MKIHLLPLGLVVSLLVALGSGCSSAGSSNIPVYDRADIGKVIREQRGEVMAVQDVLIKAPTSQAGSAGAGSRIGAASVAGIITGSPIAAASAIGSVVGGMAGAKADDRLGEEIVVATEDGQTIRVVQDRNGPPMAIGERVRIVTTAGGDSIDGRGGATRARILRQFNFAAAY